MIGQGWLLVLLTVASVARLTHMATTDVISDRPRAWIQKRGSDKIAYLVTCPWCLSVYVAAVASGAVYAWHRHWWVQVPLVALAASYLTGLAETVTGWVNAQHELAEAMTETERRVARGKPGAPAV